VCAALWLAVGLGARADSSGANVLRTGAGEPLLSLTLPLAIPETTPLPRLAFKFGFATDELDTPQTFFDSFSLSLQGREPANTLLLLTADLLGVTWAPANPGGLSLSAESLTREAVGFGEVGTELRVKLAYAVSLSLPAVLAGQTATLFLDLFDNQNDRASLGYVDDITIIPGTPVGPSFVILQSAATIQGPFADEPEATHDSSNRTLSLLAVARQRFFRARSAAQARLTEFRITGEDFVFRYEFLAPELVLQVAPSVEGPYIDEPRAVVDLAARTVTVPGADRPSYYRLRGNLVATITGLVSFGPPLVFGFALDPASVRLEYASRVTGPFAEESGVRNDDRRQTLAVHRLGGARFYRLRSDVPLRITSLQREGERLVFQYEPEVGQ
jgi:hypothetical protein